MLAVSSLEEREALEDWPREQGLGGLHERYLRVLWKEGLLLGMWFYRAYYLTCPQLPEKLSKNSTP